jgi:hypothetical protein
MYVAELIPGRRRRISRVLFPAPWGEIEKKSFDDTSSACGKVVNSFIIYFFDDFLL